MDDNKKIDLIIDEIKKGRKIEEVKYYLIEKGIFTDDKEFRRFYTRMRNNPETYNRLEKARTEGRLKRRDNGNKKKEEEISIFINERANGLTYGEIVEKYSKIWKDEGEVNRFYTKYIKNNLELRLKLKNKIEEIKAQKRKKCIIIVEGRIKGKSLKQIAEENPDIWTNIGEISEFVTENSRIIHILENSMKAHVVPEGEEL